jgi:hypothetical protein
MILMFDPFGTLFAGDLTRWKSGEKECGMDCRLARFGEIDDRCST